MSLTLNAEATTPATIIQCWRAECRSVEEFIRETRRWVASVASRPDTSSTDIFGHLEDFESRLRPHFERGCELYDSLRDQLSCIEVDMAKRNALADHMHLLGRLATLKSNCQPNSETGLSFQASVNELEWLFDELDQHEEREAENFGWLLQANCG